MRHRVISKRLWPVCTAKLMKIAYFSTFSSQVTDISEIHKTDTSSPIFFQLDLANVSKKAKLCVMVYIFGGMST